jgi:2-keto-4-pentenoate hydratase
LGNIPKISRFTLGEKIDEQFIIFLEESFRATYASQAKKAVHVNEASVRLDIIKLFVKIVWELKLLDTKKFTVLSDSLNRLGKMLGGWQKHIRQASSDN